MRTIRRCALTTFALLAPAACGTNSARLDLGPIPPGVTVESRIHYYDVTAASIGELRAAMRQQGPRWEGRAWQAVTSSQFRWTFQYATPSQSVCELRRVRVKVETIVTFPRWTPSTEPDSALMEWWRQLNAGLVEHERGHALISLKTAGQIVRELEGKTHVRCEQLGTQASASAQRLVRLSRDQQAEYDLTTRHGAAQVQQAGRLQEP